MKVLIESDSLIQFFIATHLRTTIFKNDDVDLVMYNSMPSALKIFEHIKESGIYTNCFICDGVLGIGRTKLSRVQRYEKYLRWLEMISFPKKGIKRIIPSKLPKYDIFCFCANGIFIDGLYNVCRKNNPNIKCYRYEGSLTSYLHDHENRKSVNRQRFEDLIKSFFKNYDIAKDVEKYYFFEPELIQFKHDYNIEVLPKITEMNPSVVEMFNNIFEFNPVKNRIKENVVAFEDGNLFFMNNNEEVAIFNKSSQIVGKDSFVVKMHPRASKNRYSSNVKANKGIAPWEIYLLNQDMKGKTLVTSASGSIFTTLLYFGMNVRVIMTYKCIEQPIPLINEHFENLIKSVSKLNGSNVFVPKNLDEYYSLISKQ